MKGMRGKKPRIPSRYFQTDPAASRHVWYEMLRLKVMEASTSYGKEKAASKRNTESILYTKLAYFEKKINEPLPPQLKEEFS